MVNLIGNMIAKRIKRLVKAETFIRTKSLDVIDVAQSIAIISLIPATVLALITSLGLLTSLEKTFMVRFVEPALIGIVSAVSVFITVPILSVLLLLLGELSYIFSQ